MTFRRRGNRWIKRRINRGELDEKERLELAVDQARQAARECDPIRSVIQKETENQEEKRKNGVQR